VDLTVREQRAVYDQMCAAFDFGRPEGVRVEDRTLGKVPCRFYTPPTPAEATVFFCHGGGFVVGGLDSHDSVCAEFCARTGFRVVAVDYRMSPEHPHPDDFDDAWAAFRSVAEQVDGPIVLCGDSAGGNLVAAVAHHARGRLDGRIAGQLLIYPGLGGDPTQGSYLTHAEAPGLTTKDMAFYSAIRANGVDKTGDPTWAPLHDTDFGGLPPTVILTAECDPLSSDGEAYSAALDAAGVPALWLEEAGLVHAHLRARRMSTKAALSFDRSIAALKALAQGRLPGL
jgi:acetyl esterase